ncbi:MAG: YfiR family protein [Bacteroidales bacterium]|jgi:hypothetical protein|nr:YfiR family protein [Bacteroidales bacterium]
MKKILVLLLLSLVTYTAHAQNNPQLAKAKAMLILSFVRYVGWNESVRTGDFVIGVVKDKELVGFLKKQSEGKKFGFQDVVIKEYNNVEDITDCQVICVSQKYNFIKNADKILDKVGKNTLVITEVEGATARGSMINFVVRDDKLKFELHKQNAQVAGIQISAKLSDMSSAINL